MADDVPCLDDSQRALCKKYDIEIPEYLFTNVNKSERVAERAARDASKFWAAVSKAQAIELRAVSDLAAKNAAAAVKKKKKKNAVLTTAKEARNLPPATPGGDRASPPIEMMSTSDDSGDSDADTDDELAKFTTKAPRGRPPKSAKQASTAKNAVSGVKRAVRPDGTPAENETKKPKKTKKGDNAAARVKADGTAADVNDGLTVEEKIQICRLLLAGKECDKVTDAVRKSNNYLQIAFRNNLHYTTNINVSLAKALDELYATELIEDDRGASTEFLGHISQIAAFRDAGSRTVKKVYEYCHGTGGGPSKRIPKAYGSDTSKLDLWDLMWELWSPAAALDETTTINYITSWGSKKTQTTTSQSTEGKTDATEHHAPSNSTQGQGSELSTAGSASADSASHAAETGKKVLAAQQNPAAQDFLTSKRVATAAKRARDEATAEEEDRALTRTLLSVLQSTAASMAKIADAFVEKKTPSE